MASPEAEDGEQPRRLQLRPAKECCDESSTPAAGVNYERKRQTHASDLKSRNLFLAIAISLLSPRGIK